MRYARLAFVSCCLRCTSTVGWTVRYSVGVPSPNQADPDVLPYTNSIVLTNTRELSGTRRCEICRVALPAAALQIGVFPAWTVAVSGELGDISAQGCFPGAWPRRQTHTLPEERIKATVKNPSTTLQEPNCRITCRSSMSNNPEVSEPALALLVFAADRPACFLQPTAGCCIQMEEKKRRWFISLS